MADTHRKLGDVIIFPITRTVYKGDECITLTAKEYSLLEYMVENPGIALSREMILECVWGYGFPGGTRTVDMHIRKIRSKIRSLHIETIYRHGYRLEAN